MTLEELQKRGFQIEFRSHAEAILTLDFSTALQELEATLQSLTIPIEEIIGSGGGETKGTQRLRRALSELDWNKGMFEIKKTINERVFESQSHTIDHVKKFDAGTIALEIEWNNKDPFFDRDLENFKRLHAEGAISVGVIVTRGITMQEQMRELVMRFAAEKGLMRIEDLAALGLAPTLRQRSDYTRRARRPGTSFAQAWANSFVQDKYGAATTHWRKLEDRIHRGVGNPCPLLLIGLPSDLVTFNESAEAIQDLMEEATQSTDDDNNP
ncbi:MAG: BglII/BstYI family type II restriction endonuclease [Alphaproteobacteria bacterium]